MGQIWEDAHLRQRQRDGQSSSTAAMQARAPIGLGLAAAHFSGKIRHRGKGKFAAKTEE